MNPPIEGAVDCVVNACVSGWARVPGDNTRLGIVVFVNGQEVARTLADLPRPALAVAAVGDGHHGFFMLLDRAHFNAHEPVTLSVFACSGDERVLLYPGPMTFTAADGYGFFEGLADGYARGWVAPRFPLPRIPEVELIVDGVPCARAVPDRIRHDLAHFQLDVRPTGFSIPLPTHLEAGVPHQVEVRVAGTESRLLGGPRAFEPPATALPEPPRTPASAAPVEASVSVFEVCTALDALSRRLLEEDSATGDYPEAPGIARWMRQALIPRIAAAARAGTGQALDVIQPLPLNVRLLPAVQDDGVTDIVIPVFGGREETLACILSVIESLDSCSAEIVVVDDCTPDPALASELARLAGEGLITRLVNPVNLGFVASANAGMALHPHRDVVLLNSDTLVARHWLTRMRRAAYSGSSIGTVTPFSNRATICSFPVMPNSQEMPAGWSVEALDDAFARHNAGVLFDIPTAVGFCMYIKRAVIRDTGFFDEVTWGRGYGEENDFCMRAAAHGWRHVLACDVFVQHHESVSFSAEKAALLDAHLAILHRLYPDYSVRVSRYLAQDPAASARQRVWKEILQREASARLLFITPAAGGEARRVADDLMAQLALEGSSALVLTPLSESRWRLARPGDAYGLDYSMPGEMHQLQTDLAELGVWHVHCHRLAGFGPLLLWFLEQLETGYDFSIHDDWWICPRTTLLDGDGRYCGVPDTTACDACVARAGVFPALTSVFSTLGGRVAGWRRIMFRILERAGHVMVPDADAAERLLRHVALDNLIVRPHPTRTVEGEATAHLAAPAVQMSLDEATALDQGLTTKPAGTALSSARNTGFISESLLRDYYGLARPSGAERSEAGDGLCVLGMHRSGTSALTGALRAAGFFTGRVLQFGVDNLRGHIESRQVIGLNDAVLRRSGGSWQLAPNALIWGENERLRRDAILLRLEEAGSPWLFKDPRTLLTLRFWQEGAPRLNFIGSMRHPIKVAYSLYQRNGLALTEGLRLWLAYNSRLLALWKQAPFPLLCFDLPERVYRADLGGILDQLGTRYGCRFDAEAAFQFLAAELREIEIPRAVSDSLSESDAAGFAEAIHLYQELLVCAGVDPGELVSADHCLPLAPTIAGCRALLEMKPDNPWVLTLLAGLLETSGDFAAALPVRRELVRLNPHQYLALRALLDGLEKTGQPREALECANAALVHHAENPDLHLWLGYANLRQGEPATAVEHFRIAQRADYQYLTCATTLATLGALD